MTDEEIITAVREALDRADAPIVHIHDKEGQIFATILNSVALGQLEVRGPVTETVAEEFWLRHGHIDPTDDV